MSTAGGVPDGVDYRRYATQKRTINGTIPLVSLPRVVAETAQAPGEADVVHLELSFSEDAQRRVRAAGRLTATLVLQCRRCAREYEQRVDTVVGGIVVRDDEAAASVPRDDEPIMAEGDRLNIPSLVEDELLLALPMVARCERSDCRARYETSDPGEPAQSSARRDNPFAVLSELKRGDKNN